MKGFASKRVLKVDLLEDQKIYCLQVCSCTLQPWNWTGMGSEGVKGLAFSLSKKKRSVRQAEETEIKASDQEFLYQNAPSILYSFSDLSYVSNNYGFTLIACTTSDVQHERSVPLSLREHTRRCHWASCDTCWSFLHRVLLTNIDIRA